MQQQINKPMLASLYISVVLVALIWRSPGQFEHVKVKNVAVFINLVPDGTLIKK